MAISVVQSVKGTGTSVSFSSNTTAGNCVVVVVCDKTGLGVCSVSAVKLGGAADNFGSSAAVTGGGSSTGNVLTSIWVDPNCAGGQTAVAATVANSTSPVIFAYEISGLATSSVVDQTASSGTSTGSSFSSGSTATTSQANEIWIGAVSAGATPSNPTGYTSQSQISGAEVGQAGYDIVSSTGTAVYNSTLGFSTSHSAAVVTLVAASTTVTGTGSVALGGLAFHGTGSVPGGGLALGGLTFSGSGSLNFTGSGTLALGGLALSGSQITVAPTIATEPAGVIATSGDQNNWANAASFFLGSSKGTKPVFFLMASATQALTTSFTAVTYSSSAAVFKDNQGGFAGGNPSRYTVGAAGFYVVAYSVSAASGAGRLQCYAQVTTTAANPFNPSTTVKFSSSHRAATTDIVVASSGGVVPIYLAVGDYIEVYALVGSAVNTSLTLPPQLTGEWVSG